MSEFDRNKIPRSWLDYLPDNNDREERRQFFESQQRKFKASAIADLVEHLVDMWKDRNLSDAIDLLQKETDDTRALWAKIAVAAGFNGTSSYTRSMVLTELIDRYNARWDQEDSLWRNS